ncbi:DUF4249 domain-containing protein [Maribacter algarum]|nr:DUF4249 domain-containing protein [Maribacter algarum]
MSCVEPFEAETQVFENALVIDARLTDEFKRHRIELSRARPFEQETSMAELKATVMVIEDAKNFYDFHEVEQGQYLSVKEFSAKQNSSYELRITTSDGKSYNSEAVTTPEKIAIEDLYVEIETNNSGEEGVSVFLDSRSVTNSASYFRYEYEETYKVIAPYWNPFDFDVIDDKGVGEDGDPFEVGLKPKEREERVCYNTTFSTAINQTATDGLEENKLKRHSIRFISKNNYIISHRYSILVQQHVQNLDAFSYYQSLNAFSSSESVFFENQPGFLLGNISSETNPDEKILGFFEVTAVTSKRIYFNYQDLFPLEPLPPYYINCEPIQEPLLWLPTADTHSFDGTGRSPLIEAIQAGLIKYYATNPDYVETFSIDELNENTRGPYFAKATACGDCNVLGSNIKPDFWIE